MGSFCQNPVREKINSDPILPIIGEVRDVERSVVAGYGEARREPVRRIGPLYQGLRLDRHVRDRCRPAQKRLECTPAVRHDKLGTGCDWGLHSSPRLAACLGGAAASERASHSAVASERLAAVMAPSCE